MNITRDDKRELIKYLFDAQHNVRALCQQLAISSQTYYRLRKLWIEKEDVDVILKKLSAYAFLELMKLNNM